MSDAQITFYFIYNAKGSNPLASAVYHKLKSLGDFVRVRSFHQEGVRGGANSERVEVVDRLISQSFFSKETANVMMTCQAEIVAFQLAKLYRGSTPLSVELAYEILNLGGDR